MMQPSTLGQDSGSVFRERTDGVVAIHTGQESNVMGLSARSART
jgi:hypothetical protein